MAARKAVVYAYPVVLVLVAWQLVASSGLFTAFTLPPPERVWGRARDLWGTGTLLESTTITLVRILVSFGLALVAGVTLGVLMGRVRAVRLMFRPVVSFLFPTPKVAIYPALVILFGLGTASKVAMGFAEAVFPILLATIAAASRVEAPMVWSAAGLGTSRPGILARVVLPAALPGILTGARIGLVGAISGVFVAELIVAADGLGHAVAVGYRTLATADMYVAVVLICVIGFVLDRLFLLARARLLAWSAEGVHDGR
jgi:ABC-type nitrate/sulfonate/bicarbonate transport system permease component